MKQTTSSPPRIIIVDDDKAFREYLRLLLERQQYLVQDVSNLRDLMQKLATEHFDAVLLDMVLEEESGLDILPFLSKEHPYLKVIFLTGFSNVEQAVSAIKGGASDFLSKSLSSSEIIKAVESYLAPKFKEKILNDPIALEKFRSVGLIGESTPLMQAFEKIWRIRNASSTVLLTGESGTGKELLAKSIHVTSSRSSEAFRAINCGAIPEQLLESELFGYRKGAFTDAKTDKKGIFEVCSRGTLFLDEIGDLPFSLQVKLLRVLQEQEIVPIGAHQSIKIDTRIIAATNKNLKEEVTKGTFREDLYFRLSVIEIKSAPLRERIEDIPYLVRNFIDDFNRQFGRSIIYPDRGMMAKLMAYPWPGNVRELRNAIERGVVLTLDQNLNIDDILGGKQIDEIEAASKGASPLAVGSELNEIKANLELEYLKNLLSETNGNIAKAARKSGLYRTAIYRLIDRYGINVDAFKERQKDMRFEM